MMRQPTPEVQQYAWHTAALSNREEPRNEADPQCGWYQMRKVKGGPWIPVRIWLYQETDIVTGDLSADERLMCEVDGITADPVPIWTHLRPISRDGFLSLKENRLSIPGMLDDANPINLALEPILP